MPLKVIFYLLKANERTMHKCFVMNGLN